MSDEGRDDGGRDDSAAIEGGVRVRGIYATALTHLLSDMGVVLASDAIDERFDETFPDDAAAVTVETTGDRQGVGVVGRGTAVDRVRHRLASVGPDALWWADDAPRGAVYAGEVIETLGSGAVVDLGDCEGFLPYSKSERRIEEGDRLRVQVKEPRPPWGSGRPVLDTTIRVQSSLATLVRGGTGGTDGPEMADILPTDPIDGWGVEWTPASEDAGLDALGDTLDALNARARALDAAFEGAPAPGEVAPHTYADDEATTWVWFGRECRFALDDRRRAVTTTMPGHHRVKAGDDRASAAVDLVEAVCADPGADGDQDFPFRAVTRQFGPSEGDEIVLGHGKPDGRLITLGPGEIQSIDDDGTVTVEREMTPGGTYDGLGVERRAGDVATTKIREGRWWYPTVYRGSDGQRRGTYVNVCTPVEVFPDAARYVDLHVDVVKHADGTVERVDDDELDAAADAGHVSEELAEKARSVAAAVENAL